MLYQTAVWPWWRYRTLALLAVVCLLITLPFLYNRLDARLTVAPEAHSTGIGTAENITRTAEIFVNSAIKAPYKYKFWEAGQRSRRIREWFNYLEQIPRDSNERTSIARAIEEAAASLFPFIQSSKHPRSKTPMMDLINLSERGSRGIVMPAGGREQVIRFAGHLIVSLREVLGCQLPIQIAYAGDDDLPKHYRDALASLDKTNNTSFLDVWTVFDDKLLRLGESGWAIKPFAAIASRFEQVILVDSDSVFLQDPEYLLKQQAFLDTGAYMFHDRLLWQHNFRDRHDWWKDQIKEPSTALNRSLVWTQDYAEECDSGVVVLDKSRLEVLMGLLHTAWQNTYDVREEVTYKLTYGDKESWWLGLELAGATYEFEEHYGSILGWESVRHGAETATAQICSFTIAHSDEGGKLMWYNGSLLKNKLADPNSYEVPEAWMVDGKWKKGASKKDMSCMLGADIQKLTVEQHTILQRSIYEAMRADEILKTVRA